MAASDPEALTKDELIRRLRRDGITASRPRDVLIDLVESITNPVEGGGLDTGPAVLRDPTYTQGVWDWGREWEYAVASPTHARPKVESAAGFDVLGQLWDFTANPDPSAFYYTTGPNIVGDVDYTPTVNGYAGATFPAGKYIVPPAGTYMWNAYAYTSFANGETIEGGSPGSCTPRHLDEYWDDPVQGGPLGAVGHPLLRQIDVLTKSDVIAGKQEVILTSQGFLVLPDLGPSKLHHIAIDAHAQHLVSAGVVTLAGFTLIRL
jgi:hypothetical protein